MKKKINIALIAVNILLILMYFYVSQKIFLGAYVTYFFWGISLYVFTSSGIMLANNSQNKFMHWANTVLTLISVVWFFLYMPPYTPEKAIEHLKESNEFDSSYTFCIDENNPIDDGAVGGTFVRSAYNIVAEGSERFNVKFNPASGKFNVSTDADSISKSMITIPGEGFYTIDEEFKALLSESNNSYHGLLALLKDYSQKWQSKLDYCYNTLYNLLSGDTRILLEEDQKKWKEESTERRMKLMNLYSSEFGDGYKLDILRAEALCRDIRERALYLNDILSKFSVDDSI